VVPEAVVVVGEWRGIDELAELIGAYCWVENRIFELNGDWATAGNQGTGDELEPALRVWSAGVSRRHGLLADRWAERLPVRAAVDRGLLVAPPFGPLAEGLDTLAGAPDTAVSVAAMIETVLPRLRAIYRVHHQTASPVSEGPVLEVLTAAQTELDTEISRGRGLLKGSTGEVTRDDALERAVARAFAETGVFPAVPAS
jgi:hypothetical protein